MYNTNKRRRKLSAIKFARILVSNFMSIFTARNYTTISLISCAITFVMARTAMALSTGKYLFSFYLLKYAINTDINLNKFTRCVVFICNKHSSLKKDVNHSPISWKNSIFPIKYVINSIVV